MSVRSLMECFDTLGNTLGYLLGILLGVSREDLCHRYICAVDIKLPPAAAYINLA